MTSALCQLASLLQRRGDSGGAIAAWQQVLDTGPAGDQAKEAHMSRTGIAVLENGLPPLPEPLTHRTAIPTAYWAARDTAVVLFLRFHRHRRTWHPAALIVTFTTQDGQWKPDTHWQGISFHDPFTDPEGSRWTREPQACHGVIEVRASHRIPALDVA